MLNVVLQVVDFMVFYFKIPYFHREVNRFMSCYQFTSDNGGRSSSYNTRKSFGSQVDEL